MNSLMRLTAAVLLDMVVDLIFRIDEANTDLVVLINFLGADRTIRLSFS